MPYIDKHGRPELIGHPSIKNGCAIPRIERTDEHDNSAAENGPPDSPAGGVHQTSSAAAPRR